MAKTKFTAVHRILTETKPITYIEPKTSFMMEEKAGDTLVALGAATKEEGETTKKKSPASKKSESASGGDDDLV